jgi:ABC-type branched-subunit amino acid transport system permease subunit
VSSFFELYAAVLGLVFIATVLWAPEGIMGIVARLRARFARARTAAS